MNRLEPPYPLIRGGLAAGKVIPFLGSGASLGRRNPQVMPWAEGESQYLPTAAELAGYLAQQTQFPPGESQDLSKVAQYYGVVGGRLGLQDELHRIFDRDYPLTSLHRFLAEASLSSPFIIVTTNYDDLIERALDERDRPYEAVIHTTDADLGDQLLWRPHGETELEEVSPNELDIDLKEATVIYRIHGAIERQDSDRDQYVISEDDYIDFLARMTRKGAVPAIFARPFQRSHFLFLGYGLGDWNLRVVLNRLDADLRQDRKPPSWSIQYQPSPLEQRFWQERRVEVYDLLIEEFVERLGQAGEPMARDGLDRQ